MSLFQKNKKQGYIICIQEFSTRFFCFGKSGILNIEEKGGISCEIQNTITYFNMDSKTVKEDRKC